MQNFITVDFSFREKLYGSVLLVKHTIDCTIYQITIMNGELEKILSGNRRIYEINGCLQIEACESKEQETLKQKIAEALGKLLRKPFKKINELPAKRIE
ncbi:MAG: hypothetical protein Q7T76_04785 [Ferruginibacter sp.]|nr:hypothetical protein [Ferruginibacter sp.]